MFLCWRDSQVLVVRSTQTLRWAKWTELSICLRLNHIGPQVGCSIPLRCSTYHFSLMDGLNVFLVLPSQQIQMQRQRQKCTELSIYLRSDPIGPQVRYTRIYQNFATKKTFYLFFYWIMIQMDMRQTQLNVFCMNRKEKIYIWRNNADDNDIKKRWEVTRGRWPLLCTRQGAQPWDSHDGDAAKSAAIATNAIASASWPAICQTDAPNNF